MTLHISKEFSDKGFVEALIFKIQRELLITLDAQKKRIQYWEEYINKNIEMFSYTKKSIKLIDIILCGIENITYKESNTEFSVQIDDKKFVDGVYISVSDICRLVNYGNIAKRGIYIFSDEFNQVEKDLDKLEELYYSGELI